MKTKLHYKYNRGADQWNVILTSSNGQRLFRAGPFETLSIAKRHVTSIDRALNSAQTDVVVDEKKKPKPPSVKVVGTKTKKTRTKSPSDIVVYDRFGQRTII